MQPWCAPLEQLVEQYRTDVDRGLSDAAVREQRATYGRNVLPEEPVPSWLTLFFHQFANPLMYVLLAAAVIMVGTGLWIDACVVSCVMIFNALVGAVQEGRASAVLIHLKKYLTRTCTVVRNGKKAIIETTFLVPGDIVFLREGEHVAADGRIISESGLKLDESILTGESAVVTKRAGIGEHDAPVYRQWNMVFAGTVIRSGHAKVLVAATGKESEIGKLHKIIEEIDVQGPLQNKVRTLSRSLVGGALALSAGIFCAGYLSGISITSLLTVLATLFVASIPEGLPAVLTLTLVFGARAMAQNNVLVKKLQSVVVWKRFCTREQQHVNPD